MEGVKDERYSPWQVAGDRENSHSLRTAESPLEPEGRDLYNAEQLVPGQASYQPYRYTDITVLLTRTFHPSLPWQYILSIQIDRKIDNETQRK